MRGTGHRVVTARRSESPPARAVVICACGCGQPVKSRGGKYASVKCFRRANPAGPNSGLFRNYPDPKPKKGKEPPPVLESWWTKYGASVAPTVNEFYAEVRQRYPEA